MPDFGPKIEPLPHLRLPLNRKAWVGERTEASSVIPNVRLFRDGVLISGADYLEFYSHGLDRMLWRQEIAHDLQGPLNTQDGPNETVLVRIDSRILQYQLDSGRLMRSIDIPAETFPIASSAHNVLIMSLEEHALIAFDWSGKEVWRWGYEGYCNTLATPDKYAIVEQGSKLYVLEADSGQVSWDFQAEKTGDQGLQDRSNNIVPSFPSLVYLDGVLMTIVGDGRIFKWEIQSGELVQQGQTPFRGPFQVSDTSIYILNQLQCEFSEYNHVLMEETYRENLKKELDALRSPSINALLVTDEALVWSTMEGNLMGVMRKVEIGKKRVVWIDPLGTLMPIGVPPVASQGCMYFRAISLDAKIRTGVICYEYADS